MANALHHFELAQRQNSYECIIVYYQESFEHGPRATFIDSPGFALLLGARLASSGGMVLGCWTAAGFDWLDDITRERWPGPAARS